jgi:hypothetical protein
MTKPTWRELLLLLGLAGVALVLLNHNVVRAQQSGKPAVFTQFKSKLALDGHDAVAYLTNSRRRAPSTPSPERCNRAVRHAETKPRPSRRASQAYAHRSTAATAPGGTGGLYRQGEPSHWRIVDGKLYLNYNASVQKSWEKNIPGHIAKGDQNWPVVLSK